MAALSGRQERPLGDAENDWGGRKNGNTCRLLHDVMHPLAMFRGPRWAQKTPRGNRCLHGDVCTEMSARRGDCPPSCRHLRADISVQTSVAMVLLQ